MQSGGQFEMLSREGHNSGPLRLLQHAPKHSTSLIIGTLFEGMHGIDGFSIEEHGEEQVLLLMVSLHLSDLIWTMMELGDGATPQISRRIFHDRLDPAYGMMPLSIFVIPFNSKSLILMQIGSVALIQIQHGLLCMVKAFKRPLLKLALKCALDWFERAVLVMWV